MQRFWGFRFQDDVNRESRLPDTHPSKALIHTVSRDDQCPDEGPQ